MTVNKEDTKETSINKYKNIIGIDVGQNFIATSYDSNSKVKFYKGRYLKDMRANYKHLRKQLQEKGTHNAHNKIKTLNQKENRTMTYVNHKISKEIVDYAYKTKGIIVMENITGIHLSCKVKKNNRYYRISWAFEQLQSCPKCGHTHKNNRNKKLHIFKCKACSYNLNDDLIGAKNIQLKGILEREKLSQLA